MMQREGITHTFDLVKEICIFLPEKTSLCRLAMA